MRLARDFSRACTIKQFIYNTFPAKLNCSLSLYLLAAGGSNSTFKHASTSLDLPASESERFSTVVYDNITEQNMVTLNYQQIRSQWKKKISHYTIIIFLL